MQLSDFDAEAAATTLRMDRTRAFQPPPDLLDRDKPISRLQFPDGHVGWLVTSYALARRVLTDPRFSMRPPRSLINDSDKSIALKRALRDDPVHPAHLLRLDPPDHTRVRRMLAKKYTAREMGRHFDRIEAVVRSRLDVIEAAGPPVDLVELFSQPVALMSHCALFGIDVDDAELLQRRAAIIVDGNSTADEYITNYHEYCAYLRRLVREKRKHPGDDMTSFMAGLEELTEDEIVGELVLLFDGGHETTASMLTLGVLVLLSRPDHWQSLATEPSRAKDTVEELLRFLTIFQYGAFSRTATEDVELDGVVIRAGEAVSVSLLAANRDPERFPNPDAFDVERPATGHLAFGHGVHMCLGQHQARMELQIALTELAARFPKMRLVDPVEKTQFTEATRLIYSVDHLPVAW